MKMIDVVCESCGRKTIVENGICKSCGKRAFNIDIEELIKSMVDKNNQEGKNNGN